MLRVGRPTDGSRWVTDLFSMALQEGGSSRPGGETVLAKLSELMFVEVIRSYIETLPIELRGWLSGLRDPHVGKALRLIHARPAEAWSLDRLAREAGLSRTVFAERFSDYVRTGPRVSASSISTASWAARLRNTSRISVRNTTYVHPPKTPEEGYHLSEDLADDAIGWLHKHKALEPDKPFFMYWASGAIHGPHHVAKEWADKYKGKFDDGWDASASAFSSAPRRRAGSRPTRSLPLGTRRCRPGTASLRTRSPSSAA